jgi:Protein of unknown function (DUF3618)
VSRGIGGQPRQSAAEIEDQIRRTRAEIGRTLDALGPQLEPRQLIGKGIDMITASVSKSELVPKNLGQAMRANRLPLAVITAGFAWLVARNLANPGVKAEGDASPSAPIPPLDSCSPDWAHRAAGEVGSALPDPGSVRGTFERNPLLIGLAGLVSGAAIAALMPASRREREWVDETRDELWKKAEEIGHEAAGRVRNLAEHNSAAADD